MSGSVNTNVLNNAMFFSELRKFIADNNIVGTCAGVIIALVTKDLILSFVGDIVIPLFIFLFLKLHIKWLTNILPSGKSFFDFTNFFKQFITWILTLIVTYFVIKATFQLLLGISLGKNDDKEKKEKKESFFTR
jgi:large-conductance mechanosensitive channel